MEKPPRLSKLVSFTPETNDHGDFYGWNGIYRVDYALTLRDLGCKRARQGGWVARIDGPNETYGFERTFLQRVNPLRHDPKVLQAFDFSPLQKGDFVEVAESKTSTGKGARQIYRVVHISDRGVTLAEASIPEIKRFLRGGEESDSDTELDLDLDLDSI